MRKRQYINRDGLYWLQDEPVVGGPPAPTPPSVIDTTNSVTAGAISNLNVNPPALLDTGHIWMIIFATDSSENVATPLGWSRGAETDDLLAEQPTALVLYKIAGGAEAAVNVTWGTIEEAAAYSIAIGGGVYDTSTVNNISTNGTDIDSPAIIVAEDGSLVFEFGIGDDNNPGTAQWSTVPSGTDIGEGIFRSGAAGGVFMEGKYNQQDSGAATVGSWVMDVTRPRSTISVSISPV